MKYVKFKKRIRLKAFDYKGHYCYFVTMCTLHRRAAFTDQNVVDMLISYLRDVSKKYGFQVCAYCFMPDHAHMLVEGVNDQSDFRRFISMFKQRTGYWYSQEHGIPLWQINYYEHVLRRVESKRKIASYILNNPVKEGIVGKHTDYPHLGSFVYGVRDEKDRQS